MEENNEIEIYICVSSTTAAEAAAAAATMAIVLIFLVIFVVFVEFLSCSFCIYMMLCRLLYYIYIPKNLKKHTTKFFRFRFLIFNLYFSSFHRFVSFYFYTVIDNLWLWWLELNYNFVIDRKTNLSIYLLIHQSIFMCIYMKMIELNRI